MVLSQWQWLPVGHWHSGTGSLRLAATVQQAGTYAVLSTCDRSGVRGFELKTLAASHWDSSAATGLALVLTVLVIGQGLSTWSWWRCFGTISSRVVACLSQQPSDRALSDLEACRLQQPTVTVKLDLTSQVQKVHVFKFAACQWVRTWSLKAQTL